MDELISKKAVLRQIDIHNRVDCMTLMCYKSLVESINNCKTIDKRGMDASIPSPGTVVQFDNKGWIVLGKEQDGVLLIAEDPLDKEMLFDEEGSADWKVSSIRKFLNKYYIDDIDNEYLLPFCSDLTADDSSKDYGTCEDKVFLLSAMLYRKYKEYLPDYSRWWWTLTPFSLNSPGSLRTVELSGILRYNYAKTTYSIIPCICLDSRYFIDVEGAIQQ